MDAMREWMESELDVIMVGTWMLCGNGWSLWERYHGRHMDALREWMESDPDVIMVWTWMLCGCISLLFAFSLLTLCLYIYIYICLSVCQSHSTLSWITLATFLAGG